MYNNNIKIDEYLQLYTNGCTSSANLHIFDEEEAVTSDEVLVVSSVWMASEAQETNPEEVEAVSNLSANICDELEGDTPLVVLFSLQWEGISFDLSDGSDFNSDSVKSKRGGSSALFCH